MNLSTRVLGTVVAIGTIGVSVTILWRNQPGAKPNPVPLSAPVVSAPAAKTITENISIGTGDTLDGLLMRGGMDSTGRLEMISAVRSVFDVKKFRAGAQLTFTRGNDGALEALRYIIDPDHELDVFALRWIVHRVRRGDPRRDSRRACPRRHAGIAL